MPGQLPQAVRDAGLQFHDRRRVYGKLLSPDEFGDRLLSAREDADAVFVRIGIGRIDTEHKKLTVDWETYEYSAR
jgi:hypothetical protein